MHATCAPGIQPPDSNSDPQRINLFVAQHSKCGNHKLRHTCTPYQCWPSGAFLSACPACRWVYVAQENALQGESMRRFDFRNIADTTEMIDSLRLGPSIHPFPLPSPLPRPTSHFSRPSLIPQIATRHNRGCAKCLWSCGRPTSYAGGPPANRQAFCTQRAADPGYWLVARTSPSCKERWR